jgi:hypothetical protein
VRVILHPARCTSNLLAGWVAFLGDGCVETGYGERWLRIAAQLVAQHRLDTIIVRGVTHEQMDRAKDDAVRLAGVDNVHVAN